MNGISIQDNHLIYDEMMSNREQPSKTLEWSIHCFYWKSKATDRKTKHSP